jgi:transketolase
MYKKIEWLRQEVMRVACKNHRGHIAPSLSCLDILAVLKYSHEFAADDIILSKAHGCYGLYAIEADLGIISPEDWENFNLCGSYNGLGSLGQGLPIGVGMAFGYKLRGAFSHVFVIVGDGEMQEGSNWEALSFMAHHNLRNITVIVDNNGLQAIDRVQNVLRHDLRARFEGWGLHIQECNGHDYDWLKATLLARPQVVIAHTVKGKGFNAIEGQAKFHYRVPTEGEQNDRS